MHKEWVRLDDTGEAKFWQDYYGRPDRYRYIEETTRKSVGEGSVSDCYVEYWEDVPDETDEPQVDGVYEDKDEDRWVRVNGYWTMSDNGLYNIVKWEEDFAEYAPFRLLDPSEY